MADVKTNMARETVNVSLKYHANFKADYGYVCFQCVMKSGMSYQCGAT